LNSHPRRLCLFSFQDDQGLVDDYVIVLLRELNRFVDKIIVCVQGLLTDASRSVLLSVADEVITSLGGKYRLACYAQVLEHMESNSNIYDGEIFLVDDRCYGPLFPLDELFDTMDRRSCDFWGITAHPERKSDYFLGLTGQPFFLDLNFVAFRVALVQSDAFHRFWGRIAMTSAADDAVLTTYFLQHGFSCETYLPCGKYGTNHPALFDIDETIRDRNPFISRHVFTAEPSLMERYAGDLPRAVRILEQHSTYDLSLIWRNAVRCTPLRSINTNAALTSVLPDVRLKNVEAKGDYGRVAVCVHVYYTDMLDEILALVDTIPCAYDFIATTESEAKKALIEQAVSGRGRVTNVVVRVVEQNRGRDMSALFITCRDLFLDDRYDLVCRLHTKKSPQVWAARANMFKRHMFENLLNSPGYTSNVLDLFRDRPSVGVAVPPLVHIAFPTMGHVWFVNRERVEALAQELGLGVHFDATTPVGAFGGMFWFRPRALHKLFAHPWQWTDFDGEPYPHDGSLGHALERLICYVAQDAGYLTQQIVSSHQAAWTYAMLEYKLQRLASALPFADFHDQVAFLDDWKRAGYRPSRMAVNMRLAAQMPTVGDAVVEFVLAIRRAFVRHFPRATQMLRPLFWRWQKTMRVTRGGDET